MNTHITRFVMEWYDREEDHLVGEVTLSGFTHQELHALLGLGPEDHLAAAVFPVPPAALEALGDRLGIPTAPDQFDYFITEVALGNSASPL